MKQRPASQILELFIMPPCDSPRLKWFKKHGVKFLYTTNEVGDEDEFGNELWPVYAFTEPLCKETSFGAATEDEALAKLAIKNGLKLWNEAGF